MILDRTFVFKKNYFFIIKNIFKELRKRKFLRLLLKMLENLFLFNINILFNCLIMLNCFTLNMNKDLKRNYYGSLFYMNSFYQSLFVKIFE